MYFPGEWKRWLCPPPPALTRTPRRCGARPLRAGRSSAFAYVWGPRLAFPGAGKVVSMDLSNNSLSGSLPKDTFDGYAGLAVLQLSYQALDLGDPEWLEALPQLLVLELAGNRILIGSSTKLLRCLLLLKLRARILAMHCSGFW